MPFSCRPWQAHKLLLLFSVGVFRVEELGSLAATKWRLQSEHVMLREMKSLTQILPDNTWAFFMQKSQQVKLWPDLKTYI